MIDPRSPKEIILEWPASALATSHLRMADVKQFAIAGSGRMSRAKLAHSDCVRCALPSNLINPNLELIGVCLTVSQLGSIFTDQLSIITTSNSLVSTCLHL